MTASSLFYSKQALKYIEPLIALRQNKEQINKLPIIFTSNQIQTVPKFYQKYLKPAPYAKLFKQLLLNIGDPRIRQSQIQQKLWLKIKQNNSLLIADRNITKTNQNNSPTILTVDNVDVLDSKIVQRSQIKGIFMHRKLNMPAQCYSVQQPDQNRVILRMRGKFTKDQHMMAMDSRIDQYNKNDYQLQKYYCDGYHNFIQNQAVSRLLIQIHAKIRGQVRLSDNKIIKLPIDDKKPITSHLLQVQKIDVPGRGEEETSMITDIDYFMAGNPHVQY